MKMSLSTNNIPLLYVLIHVYAYNYAFCLFRSRGYENTHIKSRVMTSHASVNFTITDSDNIFTEAPII